ncbi:MAG: hypothetical protein ACHBN1_13095 [Heteroscytonema crispum UTEX LB 1556]
MAVIFYTAFFWALVLFRPTMSAIAIRYSLSIRWQLILLGICIFYGILPLLIGWRSLISLVWGAIPIQTVVLKFSVIKII